MSSISSIEMKKNVMVVYMSDLNKRKVIEHNDLISSVAKMDKVPLKIFELAVSCIDTQNFPKDNTVYLSKQELFSFFDVKDNDKHNRFKFAVEKMQKQAYFEIRVQKDRRLEFESIVPISTVKWNNYNDDVFIRFNPDIMPYLIDLKTNFTQYVISDIMELNSKYSIILYKWLCMYYNQYEHYQANGGRRQEQLEKYSNPTISIDELRKMTDTEKEYKEMYNFTKRILNSPIKEINEYTHFNVRYDKIKKGRAVDRIQFHITKKQVAKNEFYKDEQQDPVYLKSKEEKETQKQTLFTQAMQSPYTTFLGESMLLGFKDTQDIDLMAKLQQTVYPLYDQLKEYKGIEEVERHISYVSEKQEDYSKKNILKYLKIAVENYLKKESR